MSIQPKPKVNVKPTAKVKWADNINNKANAEFVEEVKFNNKGKATQEMFNQRYLSKNGPAKKINKK